MKVHYGPSLPPGLTAPTRGELLIRVERLALQDELLAPLQAPGAPLVPVDHCAIQFAFWGMDASAASPQTSSQHIVSCVPATDAHSDRGVQRVVFRVTTLEPQLIQYFQHMHHSSYRGVQLRVTIPPQFSGKKVHVPVGVAIVDVSGLTTTSPIHGWFHVMHHDDQQSCIGRVKLSISLNMYAAPPPPVAKESNHHHAAPVERPESVDVLPVDLSTKEPAPPQSAKQARIVPEVSLLQHHSAAATATLPPPPASQQPNAIGDVTVAAGNTTLNPIPHHHHQASSNPIEPQQHTNHHANPNALFGTHHDPPTGHSFPPLSDVTPHVVNSTIVGGSGGDALLRGWFERGVALRNRMTQACSSNNGGSSNVPPLLSGGSSTMFLSSSGGASQHLRSPQSSGTALPPFRAVPQISGVEHLLRTKEEQLGGLNTSASSSGDHSSSSGDDDDDVSVSSASEDNSHSPRGARRHDGHLAVGTTPPPFTPESTSISCDSTLELSLSHIGFSSGPVPRPELPMQYRRHGSESPPLTILPQSHLCELRFSLRWSRDVVLADPTLLGATSSTVDRDSSAVAALSSFVHVLPFEEGDEDKVITIEVPRVLSYTTQSKIVLECIHVISAEAPPRERHPVKEAGGQTSRGGHVYTFDVDRMQRDDMSQQQAQERSAVRRVVVAETVVGVCVLDLCARSVKRCGFHNPLTGVHHVWADCSLELRPSQHPTAVAIPSTTTYPGEDIVFAAEGYHQHLQAAKDHPNKNNGTKDQLQRRRPSRKDETDSDDEEEDSDSGSDSVTGTTDDSTDAIRHDDRHRRRHRSATPSQDRSPRIVVYTGQGAAESTTETTITVRQQGGAPGSNNNSVASQKLLPGLSAAGGTTSAPPSASAAAVTRFHLSVVEAKGLPLVCAQEPTASLRKDISNESSYVLPRTFVCLDEILELRKSKLSGWAGHSATTPDVVVPTHPQPLPIEASWYVEAAVQGSGSRSDVQAEGSVAPRYTYESIVAIPTPTLASLCEVAGSLDIGLYHWTPESDSRGPISHRTEEDDTTTAENAVWRSARPMGKVIVDLSPLRYLSHTDGWHKVVSSNDVLETVIGYMRVSVRIL